MADLLAMLYGEMLNVRPDDPQWPERDRFILSKGHCCTGVYAALALRGFSRWLSLPAMAWMARV